MKLWKWLAKDRMPTCGVGQWPEVGEWLEVEGDLAPCKNGLHLCREKDLLLWVSKELYEAEYDGEIIECDDKVVVRKARLTRRVEAWNERTARAFACDCAEHVLHLFEKQRPDDKRPRQAIEVARRYAIGQATYVELDAAGSAAESAAWSAAGSAAWSAAGSAAWSAAGSAAWSAAWNAAWTAEREWQTERLMEYLEGGDDEVS